jgi:DMSO/TMAO reductase YedYZ molybdopterin-dependent catalytic subunit
MIRRFNAGDSGLKRALIRGAYYVFIVLPFPLRRLAVAGFITGVLRLKRWLGVERQSALTARDEIGTLSFWGVPDVDLGTFMLTVDGAVARPRMWRFEELAALPSREVAVRMDCVSGFRNNTMMRGVTVASVLEMVGPLAGARRAIFWCADGYDTSSTLADVREAGAMLVWEVNGEREARFGFPLRLAMPGRYGYQWAKWVQRIEVVRHDRQGYWPRRGLPDRARLGDRW